MNPTKRQVEALISVYYSKSVAERTGPDGQPVGRRTRSVGGAIHRMKEAMGESGWLVQYPSRHGRVWYMDKLTAAGLAVLKTKHPGLPEIDARLAAAEAAEAEAAQAAAIKAEEERVARVARANARHVERARLMREVAQSYQVNVDLLSDDQCAAMWLEIAEKEMGL